MSSTMHKVDLIRQAMSESEPRTAAELSQLSGIDRLKIAALLSYDIKRRRVVVDGEYPSKTYRKATLREQAAPKLARARKLLEFWGYTVVPPGDGGCLCVARGPDYCPVHAV